MELPTALGLFSPKVVCRRRHKSSLLSARRRTASYLGGPSLSGLVGTPLPRSSCQSAQGLSPAGRGLRPRKGAEAVTSASAMGNRRLELRRKAVSERPSARVAI